MRCTRNGAIGTGMAPTTRPSSCTVRYSFENLIYFLEDRGISGLLIFLEEGGEKLVTDIIGLFIIIFFEKMEGKN